MDERTVRELIAKWRSEYPDYPSTTLGACAKSAVKLCADELEAALASEPPAPSAAPAAFDEGVLEAKLDNLAERSKDVCNELKRIVAALAAAQGQQGVSGGGYG
jgi:hypothetical protein